MFRIAVCDDNDVILDCISLAIAEFFTSSEDSFTLHSFSNGNLLLMENAKEPFDVLFLDIQMPNMDGFEIARAIRQRSEDTYVIFISSNDTLVFRSLDYQPFHFICKGNGGNIASDVKRVMSALVKNIERHSTVTINLTVTESRSIAVSDILYIEADGHYLKYHIKNEKTLRMRGDMLTVCEAMAAHYFIQIHRSYLVNPLHISRLSMQHDCVTLSDGTALSIGRNFKKDAAKKYGSFCSRGSIM